ncbi:MAG: glycosyltransferase, partial [Oscillospiraceae bacterium]
MENKKVDIIIPVYNAFDDLQLCVKSLKTHVNFNLHRVLLIDDKSPDERILPYLKTLESDHFIIQSNAVNLGFSATVNEGIAYSNRDVILLNSDTIVTKSFIEKIISCAYADRLIATVTPLSNNGSICSVPNYREDNVLPVNLSIDEVADLVEKCSLHRYPNIPTAVGFCMFIKRQVIDEIGLFDAQTFGKGYGEENDFCCRAQEMGYHHVMCDDTFVYHSGTVSFTSEEKKELIAEHEQILLKRYPVAHQKTCEYIFGFANKEITDNVKLHMEVKNSKKNILYLIHLDFRKDAIGSIGGTQFHVKDLTNQLKENYNIYVAARDGSYLRVTVYIGQEQTSFRFFIGEKGAVPILFSRKLKKLFETIIDAFCIDLVHIHHTLGIGLDLYKIANKKNIPLFATLHDLYYICPTIKLLDCNNEVCMGKEDCKNCMQEKLKIGSGEKLIQKWQEEHGKALFLCDKIFLPSKNTKSIFSHYYPNLKEQLMVISHGIKTDTQVENNHKTTTKDPMKVYFEDVLEYYPNSISGWAYLEDKPSKQSDIYLHITDVTGKQQRLLCEKSSRLDVAVAVENLSYEYSGFSLKIPSYLFSNGKITIQVIIENNKISVASSNIIEAEYKGYHPKVRHHVAFIGGMYVEKGSDTIYDMIKHSKNKILFHIFGGIEANNLYSLDTANF